MNREHVPYFTEKTKLSLCVDPDFHMMGAYAGALTFMRDAGVGDGDARGWFGCL